ncbi:hypothetical protein GOP47_0028690, partial [Adiantum capillus-veneris]
VRERERESAIDAGLAEQRQLTQHLSTCRAEEYWMEDQATQKNLEGKGQEVKVLFFARAREIAGLSETTLKMEEKQSSKTIKDCVNLIIRQFPGLEEIKACMLVAQNQEYVDESSIVKNGDELAFIPPISGG